MRLKEMTINEPLNQSIIHDSESETKILFRMEALIRMMEHA